MPTPDVRQIIRARIQPAPSDVERAKRAIVPLLSDPAVRTTDDGFVPGENIVAQVSEGLFRDLGPARLPDGILTVQPDPHLIRSQIATREAIHLLRAAGSGPL